MFNLHKSAPRLAALVLAAALSACGSGGGGEGGGGSSAPPPPPNAGAGPFSGGVPASALQSVNGLITFMDMLIATMTNDTSEPILLGESALPVDDTI